MKKILILILVLFSINIITASTGCCFVEETGRCWPNAEQNTCNGLFYTGDCNTWNRCEMGCCLLGLTSSYTTSSECNILSDVFGVSPEFDTSLKGENCTALSSEQNIGACVFEEEGGNSCIITRRNDCTGVFYNKTLCTAPGLNTSCEKTTETTIISGKDEVFFVDTCDNPANIYDADKINDEDYWTYMKTKEESCNSNQSNANSERCGNCNYDLGSVGSKKDITTAHPIYGSYICKNLNCVDAANGKTWCMNIYGQSNKLNANPYGVTASGRNTPAPDITYYKYTTNTGAVLEIRQYNQGDYMGGFGGGTGRVTSADGEEYYFDANKQIRKGGACDDDTCSADKVICGTGHGEEMTWQYDGEGGGVSNVQQHSDGWGAHVDQRVGSTYKNLEGMSGTIVSVETSIEKYIDNSAPVGSRYFRRYCQNGVIKQEPCYDFRGEVCENGECVANPWRLCMANINDTENCPEPYCYTLQPLFGPTNTEIKCTGEQPEEPSEKELEKNAKIQLISDSLGLGICLPKTAPGLKFYGTDDTLGGTYAESICSKGSWSSTITFKKSGDCWYLATQGTPYGNAGLLEMDPDLWEDPEGADITADFPVYKPGVTNIQTGREGLLQGAKKGDSVNIYLYCDKKKDLQEWVDIITALYHGGGDVGATQSWLVAAKYIKPLREQAIKIVDLLPDWLKDPLVKEEEESVGLVKLLADGEIGSLPINQDVVAMLNHRCQALGDCDGKVNWVVKHNTGGGVAEEEIPCSKSGKTITCEYSYGCEVWPGSNNAQNCDICGKDGFDCTEYRCKSLGKNCEYEEPDGIDTGYCFVSGDIQGPNILSHAINPQPPIKPFTPVEIAVTTDEDAFCKFSIGDSSSQYDLGFGGTKHSVVLSLPGQVPEDIIEKIEEEYEEQSVNWTSFTVKQGQKVDINIPYNKDWIVRFEGKFTGGAFGESYFEADDGARLKARVWNNAEVGMTFAPNHIFFTQARVGNDCCVSLKDENSHLVTDTLRLEDGKHHILEIRYSPKSGDMGRAVVFKDGRMVADFDFYMKNIPSSMTNMKMNKFTGTFKYKVLETMPSIINTEDEIPIHELISGGGTYNMMVTCEDFKGNIGSPYSFNFEVMPDPDYDEPEIIGFNPVTGSPIKYNTTEKQITIRLNEPAECKWSFEDKEYDDMENNFTCSNDMVTENLSSYYVCSGILDNVTLLLNDMTEYYIRCKDQPWLEGNENDLYHRNINTESERYILRPSEELSVYGLSLEGEVRTGPSNTSVLLIAVTNGGGVDGNAVCEWLLINDEGEGSYQEFSNTNSEIHKHLLSGLDEGDYIIKVRCKDVADNYAYSNSSFRLKVDSSAPKVTRVYRQGSSLVVITNEESTCKYMLGINRKCNFYIDNENASTMLGAEKRHAATGENKQETYGVRCIDYFGNEGCAIIIRTL